MANTVQYHQAGDIGRIVIDLPDKPVNVLSQNVIDDLADAITLAEVSDAKVVTVESGKPGVFVAGADIFQLQALSRDELLAYLEHGQQTFARLSDMDKPTIAIVGGAALGGGLELALACDHILAVDHPKTLLGLPETTLGLIPGWGGCVRLPRRIGPTDAADAILSGRPMKAKQAGKLGLAEVVPAVDVAEDVLLAKTKRGDALPPDAAILSEARAKAAAVAHQQPALLRAVEVMITGLRDGDVAGFEAERIGLADLRDTTAGQNLLRVFTRKQAAKKRALKAAGGTAKEVTHVGVIGGGTMGSGIAATMLQSGMHVTLAEVSDDAATAAKGRVAGLLDRAVNKGKLSEDKKAAMMAAMNISADGASTESLTGCQLIVEAASENPAIKAKVFAILAERCPDAVLTTNTSSLSLTDIASGVGDRKSDVVGLHYFNPVPMMPLVEVVRHGHASDDAVATAVSVALANRKTPVVCNDGPGFIVNRILVPYLSEACRAVGEGADMQVIDDAVVAWGMPMGPVALMDTIGLDVMAGIFDAMHTQLGDRVQPSKAMQSLIDAGHLGRKSGAGFYTYPSDRNEKPTPNTDALGIESSSDVDTSAERFVLLMCNEAARVLDEGVAESADDIDLATLLGTGLSPWRGGIARHIEDLGPGKLTRQLESLAERHGERFEPAERLT